VVEVGGAGRRVLRTNSGEGRCARCVRKRGFQGVGVPGLGWVVVVVVVMVRRRWVRRAGVVGAMVAGLRGFLLGIRPLRSFGGEFDVCWFGWFGRVVVGAVTK